jgi:hypothetical protein
MILMQWLILLVLILQPLGQVGAPADALQEASAPSFIVRSEPSPYLAVGDIASFEVTAPPGLDLSEHSVTLSVIHPFIQELGRADFFPGGDRPFRARFPFVWDTGAAGAGTIMLQFSVTPAGWSWTEVIRLHSPPPQETDQQWAVVQLDCCTVHYVTGTRAERELDLLISVSEEQVLKASERMQTVLPEPVNIIFLPRVIGHGGFAGQELFISYPDVNYTNLNLEVVLHHEIVHRLDRELGGPYRPSIFVEGLAVYLSEGHYQEEDLVARSAALLDLGLYLPLQDLANNFYPSQHESGYMLAGALVHYLVEMHGYEAFDRFYRSIQPPQDGRDATAIDLALQQNFAITFAALEEQFIAWLEEQPFDADEQTNVRLTIELYDTLREYQQRLDPSAYFRNVWLFPDPANRERGIVTNWTRWPRYPQNQVIERLLEAAGQDLVAGRYISAEVRLDFIRAMLPGIPTLIELPYQPQFVPLFIE